MMARARIALVFLSAVVIGAGALGGWRISVRFVGAGTQIRGAGGPPVTEEYRRVPIPDGHARAPAIPAVPSRSASHLALMGPGPATMGTKSGAASRSPLVSTPVSPAAPGAADRAPTDPPADAPAPAIPKKSTGLHMTFQREWHQVTYEIGSPTLKPPVRFLCQACPAVNWATHQPIDQHADQEKIIVNAATVGASSVVCGRITLMEWDP
jgi:hypothetical protein